MTRPRIEPLSPWLLPTTLIARPMNPWSFPVQNKNTSTSLITRLVDKINTLSKNYSIIISCIPSHIGVHGNERADKAGKKHSWQTYAVKKILWTSYFTYDKNS